MERKGRDLDPGVDKKKLKAEKEEEGINLMQFYSATIKTTARMNKVLHILDASWCIISLAPLIEALLVTKQYPNLEIISFLLSMSQLLLYLIISLNIDRREYLIEIHLKVFKII